jgi:hypothetical protein
MDTLTADPPIPAAGASDEPDRSPSHRSLPSSDAPRPGTPEFEALLAELEAGFTAGPSTPLTAGPAVRSSEPRPAVKSRPARRPRIVTCLSVAIASLLCASGTVLTERITGQNLSKLVADVIRPDDDGADPGGTGLVAAERPGGATSATTGPATPGTTLPPSVGTPAAGPDDGASASNTSKPGSSGSTTRSPQPARGQAPASSGTVGAPAPGSGTTAGTAPAADGRSALEREIDALKPFVEREAGLTFKGAVPVRIMSDAEFSARLAELNWLPKGDAAVQLGGVYRTLGIIDGSVDLPTELAKFSRSELVTLYDVMDGQLLVRDRAADPYLRAMLVRELTRALNDQHFDIYRPASAGFNDESLEGLKALAEGDATRMYQRYLNTLTASDKALVVERNRAAGQATADINPAVRTRFGYYIAQGIKLVEAILSAGNRSRLNAAFAAPPASSEQILHPERYLGGDNPRPPAEPAADGAVVGRGVLGEVGLYLMLASATDENTASLGSQGWGGDRYVSWRDGARTCVRQTIETDSAQDSAELGAALQRWAQARPGAEVTGSGPFTITRCS